VTAPSATEYKRVLIANRGEIALRVVRACRDAGLASIAVYAEPDAGAPFAGLADEAVPRAGTSSADTYLDIAKLLAAAEQAGGAIWSSTAYWGGRPSAGRMGAMGGV